MAGKYYPTRSTLATPQLQKYFHGDEKQIKVLDQFFGDSFDYLALNSVPGDYLEFGSGFNVISFRLAAKYRDLTAREHHLFAFDSFQGLPEPKGIDEHPGWEKGSMATSLDQFHSIVQYHGAKSESYTAVPGFYEQTLVDKAPPDYGCSKIAFAFVDCDLYASAAICLNFISRHLSHGAILAFDDWNCFCASNKRGERRALQEFLAAHPEFSLTEFLTFGWHGKSFIVHREDQDV